MHEKKKQRTGQHDPTRTSCPHPTQLCPWATIWPDISPRPTSPAHALRYCGKLGQEKLKWLNVKKVTPDKVKILCASRHFSLHSLTEIKILLFFMLYRMILHFRIWHCQSSAQSEKKHQSYFISFYYLFIFYNFNSSKQLNNPINKNQQFQFYFIRYHLTMKQKLKNLYRFQMHEEKNTVINTIIMYITISQ